MKLRKHALAFTTAALLATSAYAADKTDAISASFERDLYREPSALAVAPVSGEADPVNATINAALSAVPDPVLASFERDLYREPHAFTFVSVSGETDPMNAIINAALSTVSDPVLASFVRDLYREPSAFEVASVGEETIPLNAIINTICIAKKTAYIKGNLNI